MGKNKVHILATFHENGSFSKEIYLIVGDFNVFLELLF